MPDTNVAYHADGPYQTARPAINVKLHCAGVELWPVEIERAYGHGDEYPDDNSPAGALVDMALARVTSDFWQAAQEIAEQKGLGEIVQEGRSGGWLVFTDGRDPQHTASFKIEDYSLAADPDVRAHDLMADVRTWLASYRSMVEWTETWIADAPRKVRDLAQQYAMDAAGEPAALRMFAFDASRTQFADTVRGALATMLTEGLIETGGVDPEDGAAVGAAIDDARRAEYVAARASESLSYGDIAYAQEQGWCSSSPDGMGPHRPDDTTDPVTCAECGAEL